MHTGLQRLSSWFRLHHTTGSTRVTPKVLPGAGPLQKLLGAATRRPNLKSPFSVYQKEHWELRVKPIYERLWEAETKLWKDCTPQQRVDKGLSKPVSVRTMTKTTADCWASETAQFKEEVNVATAAWNAKKKAMYELGLIAPLTPLDYHKSVAQPCLRNELTNILQSTRRHIPTYTADCKRHCWSNGGRCCHFLGGTHP